MTAATGRSPILRATYIALAVATIAAATAGLHLTFLTHETRTTFAWQIKNPMTAAFFGAAYVTAGIAVTATMLRATRWEELRPAAVVTCVFITLAGIITLIHLGEFQYDSNEPVARFVSWVWLVLYLGLPFLLVASVVRQEIARVTGSYESAEPLIPGFRAAFVVTGTLLALLGAGMALHLKPAVDMWPWALPALSARVVGGWVLITGLTQLWCTRENDWSKVRTYTIASLVFYPLQFIAAARFSERFEGDNPRTWVYLAGLGVLFALQAAACVAHIRRGRRRTV